jgi:predicted nuclease of predicted toxin-antitoxin system
VKFVADENIDRPIVELLRRSGYIVFYIQEMEPGITDEQVIQRANNESALLLTSDRDFGEMVFRQGRNVHGIILTRLAGLSLKGKAEILLKAIKEHEDNLYGNFTVITPNAIRIRTAKYLKDLS